MVTGLERLRVKGVGHLRSLRYGTAIALVAVASPAIGLTDPAISDYMARWDASVRAIRAQRAGGDAKVLAACLQILGWAFDLDAMAETASAGAWARMSPAQQDRFESAFRRKIAGDCVSRAHDDRGQPMTVLGVRSNAKGERLATAHVGFPDETGQNLTWRLHLAKDKTWRAIDLVVDGHSLVANERDKNAGVLQGSDGSIDALIMSVQAR